MPARHIARAPEIPHRLEPGLAQLRADLEIPHGFGETVEQAAAKAASRPVLPALDRTDIELVTIDPESSMDLDQAVAVARHGSGFRVWYAIADVASWVTPGGPIDEITHERGQTYYAPDRRDPLHPEALGESAASLLADGHPRPAVLWTMDLDADGVRTDTQVEQAAVRSRAKLSYTQVQQQLDAGTADESLQLLREVGLLRQQQEAIRGGVSLNIPEQEIVADGDRWRLTYRTPLPIEAWNAQISLLTGNAAAELMIAAKVGILRTLPPAVQAGIDQLRHIAKGLKIAWPATVSYPDFVRSLDPSKPTDQAMLTACTVLFRGAGYTAFDGELPDQNLLHGALAMPYAHTTAPLRRLVDRYVSQTCVAIHAGQPVPEWVREQLPTLPSVMGATDSKARKYERGIVDLLEAVVLADKVGDTFEATVVDVAKEHDAGTVMISDPAIMAPVTGKVSLGDEVTVRLTSADVATGKVEFAVA